jgi:transposase InsO family protein
VIDKPAANSIPDPWQEEEHVQRMQTLWNRERSTSAEFTRRGFGQQPRRRLEHELRSRIVTFCASLDEQGYTLGQKADLLNLSSRTLRQWQYNFEAQARQAPSPLILLGRPVHHASVAERNTVIELLHELGPATGLPTLRASFPDMLRAELEDLLRRYRRVWRRRYHEAMHVLSWQVPGSVWAIDFTEAPAAIDGLFPYLLAVRDLASGRQLLWLPVRGADGQEARRALALLFAVHGAPLVLKSDNGSPFDADSTRALLHSAGVIPLFSPPYYPQYNGAIEAGIGSLATRTEHHAARHDRPGHWTCDDVAAAQAEANNTARPHGPTRPTPDQSWATRPTITAAQRILFQETVNRHRKEVCVPQGQPVPGPRGHQEERAMDRLAIQRALVEHAYLLFSRRRIPLPFTRRKVTEIT